MKTSYPNLPIVGTKRGIGEAFTRCHLRPDSAVLFGAEFELVGAREDNAVFFYLVLPFGFAGSPGVFGRLTKASRWYRRRFTPPHILCGMVQNPSQRQYLSTTECSSMCILERGQNCRIGYGGGALSYS